jgi:hypothetical protein
MEALQRCRRRLTHMVLCLVLAWTAIGCCHVRRWLGFDDPCADIPPGAIPQPTGTYACQWQAAQAARAETDDLVVYGNQWLERSALLSPAGQQHVHELALRLTHVPLPVLVEASGDAALDAARRDAIVAQLAQRGVPDPHLRVVVGRPAAQGLYGDEAGRIYRGYLGAGSRGASSLGAPVTGGFGSRAGGGIFP